MQADMNFFFDTNFHKNITKTTLVFIEMIVHIVGPKSEKVKKNLQTFFKENGWDMIIHCYMNIVNYLNVTLNLENSAYPIVKKIIN